MIISQKISTLSQHRTKNTSGAKTTPGSRGPTGIELSTVYESRWFRPRVGPFTIPVGAELFLNDEWLPPGSYLWDGGDVLPADELVFLAEVESGLIDSIGLSSRTVQKKQYLSGGSITPPAGVTFVGSEGTGSISAGGVITGDIYNITDSAGNFYPFGTGGVLWCTSGGENLGMTGVTCVESLTFGSNWLNVNGYGSDGGQIKWVPDMPEYVPGRIVTNQVARTYSTMPAPEFLAYFSSTSLPDGFRKVETTAASPARCFWYLAFQCVAGKRYGLRWKARNISGTILSMFAKVDADSTGTFVAVGSLNDTAPDGSTAVLGKIYDCTASGLLAFRIGVNTNAPQVNHPCSAEFGDFCFSEIPLTQSTPSEFVPHGLSALMHHAFAGSIVGGLVVDVVGAIECIDRSKSVLVMGDSFGNQDTEWPQVITNNLLGQIALYSNSISGRTLATGITDLPSQISLSAFNYVGLQTYAAFQDFVARPGLVIVALGVNDTNAGATLSNMQDRFEDMTSACFDGGAINILWVNIPPWKANASWTQGKEDVRTAYNVWLPTRVAQDSRLHFFDISSVLGDTDPLYLKTEYERSGIDEDGLHPNATGSAAIAAAISPVITSITGVIVNDLGRCKKSLIESSLGVFEWPVDPELIEIVGLDNAIYTAEGAAVTFASPTLALAALASFADDTYLFGGTKMAALYSADMSEQAVQIKRYVVDTD